MTMKTLEPIDGRKSFNNKAKVVTDNGVHTLFSYDTPVAKIENGTFTELPHMKSQTTTRHIKAFRAQYE